MKNKKLEKVTKFIFKRIDILNLSKEQMQKINGGNGQDYLGGPSTNPGCVENKTVAATVVG